MIETEIIVAILGSTVFGTIIGSLFSSHVNSTNNKRTYVSKERENWRKDVRDITSEFVGDICNEEEKIVIPKLKRAIALMTVKLNPEDKQDNLIVYCMKWLFNGYIIKHVAKNDKQKLIYKIDDKSWSIEDFSIVVDLFVEQVARLLKQDWERLKLDLKEETKISKEFKVYDVNTYILYALGLCLFVFNIDAFYYTLRYCGNTAVRFDCLAIIRCIVGFMLLYYAYNRGLIKVTEIEAKQDEIRQKKSKW